ncbi:cytochrome P450 [Gordonia sp. VNK21]|uniref:cytochrome P450 n=1 Tax=Gordonia sp. VNK21 TaxID=3382483 RepID=UPI0038D4BCCF
MTSRLTTPLDSCAARTRHWHLAPPGSDSGVGGPAAAPTGAVTGPGAHRSRLRALASSAHFVTHLGDVLFDAASSGGEVLRFELYGGPGPVAVIFEPSYIKSVVTADEAIAPSATHESPLRPIVGGESVLTSLGRRHRQQRALLMPRFHGRSVASYQQSIDDATETALRSWPVGRPVPLAIIAQQITLDVIMAGIFGLPEPSAMTPAETAMRIELLRLLRFSTTPIATATQLMNARREDPVGLLKLFLRRIDRRILAVIDERRTAGDAGARDDILALLLEARTEDGAPLSDSEIRDELITLLLAGHETTANTVAWTFERLTRFPQVYGRAREAVRSGDDDYLEALLNESMRSRPVVPAIARHLLEPWDFGDDRVPDGVTALISILLLHHRDDLYPQPFDFRPERFVGVRPGPHELMPFGGGNRRCLGAALAMAELRTVVGELLRRVDLQTTDAPGEAPRHRNVTMIPKAGGRVTARSIQR